MWIVLLDHSGSMGDPFETQDAATRRTRVVDAETKLQAAREVLREELQELREIDPAMTLVVFAFTSSATLLYEGPLGDAEAIERALGQLAPHNGTDIAAALNAASVYKETHTGSTLAQLLLISDGKSERVEAMAAARRCIELQLALSMLLIDPTDEGKAFARDVVRGVGGMYQPVTSRADLQAAAQETTAAYAQDLARAANYLAAAAHEAQSVKVQVADHERVKFTAGYPGRIQPGHDYPLRVYLHLDSDTREVLSRLEQMGSGFAAWRRGEAEGNQRIPVGTPLELTPRISFVQVSPPQQRVTWAGSMEELSFRIHYAGPDSVPAPPCSGFVDISTGGLLLAQIPVSLLVAPGESQVEQRTAEMISRVFASYSHHDEPIVRACKAAYRALGVQLFVDKDDILAGQRWRDVLRRNIGDHDLFQLFWSRAAADSDEVANEWTLAKEIAQARATDFIRPLFWVEPMPQPPTELGDLHFARLDLASLRLPDLTPAQPDTASAMPSRTAQARLEASFPIMSTVDADSNWLSWLHERMGEVVPFLEDLLGVRYFPPATFLVGEHVVQAAREVLTTDNPDPSTAPGGGDDDIEAILEILQALALGFHVGKLAAPDCGWNDRAAFFGADSPESLADYEHVIYMAESIFSGPATQYLAGADVLAGARRSLKELLQDMVDGRGGYGAKDLVRRTLNSASPAERSAVESVATRELEGLGSFDNATKQAAAARLLDSNLPGLADRYGIFEFFHRSEAHSLRNHADFREYLADFVRHWLDYVGTARAKRPAKNVDIGYAIAPSAFDWLRRNHPEVQLTAMRTRERRSDGSPRVDFELPIESYERCVERLSELLLVKLSGPRSDLVTKLLNVTVATHGIYIPAFAPAAQARFAGFLAGQNWPSNATLPGQHKILLCVSSIERFAEKLVEMGRSRDEADEMARRFSLAVLVHEHFHAAVASGLDRTGRAALGAEYPDRWAMASALNESIAVWCERHYFRSDAGMLELIDDYISSGSYPVWPYRGGETVESIYATGGVPAVRGWMRLLRDDPENAQQTFNERISSMSASLG